MKHSAKYKKLFQKAKKRAFQTPLSAKQDLEKFAKKMMKKPTSPERIFQNLLKKHKVPYQSQFILNGKIFDYFLPDTKTLVEIQGDYWHGNPEVYEDFSGYQKYIKKRDLMKRSIALGMGYKFIEFWEKDLNEDKNKIIQELKDMEIIKIANI